MARDLPEREGGAVSVTNDEAHREPPETQKAPGERLHLADRLALRPKEAAEALGISERKLREMLPELPHVRFGRLPLLPVKALERWLEDHARAQPSRADQTVREILERIEVTEDES